MVWHRYRRLIGTSLEFLFITEIIEYLIICTDTIIYLQFTNTDHQSFVYMKNLDDTSTQQIFLILVIHMQVVIASNPT